MPNCLLVAYKDDKSSEDLNAKSKRAFKSIIQICSYLPALEQLLKQASSSILKYVVSQYAKTLPHDLAARRTLCRVEIQKVQEIGQYLGRSLGSIRKLLMHFLL